MKTPHPVTTAAAMTATATDTDRLIVPPRASLSPELGIVIDVFHQHSYCSANPTDSGRISICQILE
jgi:hypothetical protein